MRFDAKLLALCAGMLVSGVVLAAEGLPMVDAGLSSSNPAIRVQSKHSRSKQQADAANKPVQQSATDADGAAKLPAPGAVAKPNIPAHIEEVVPAGDSAQPPLEVKGVRG